MARLIFWVVVSIALLGGMAGIYNIAQYRYDEVVNTREQARSEWMKKVTIAPDCKNPQSTLKIQECQNKLDEAFNKYWLQLNAKPKPN